MDLADRRKEYQEWIESYIADGHRICGECHDVSLRMQAAFPELTLHGGYVRTPLGNDLHFWLTDPDGQIVDPTAAQFGYLEPKDYEDAGTTDPLELLSLFFMQEAVGA